MSEQKPIGSRFSASSTAREVTEGIDLSGKTAIVTGGYSGLGVETTRALAGAGARVIVPARSREKAERTLAGIDNVVIEAMDLADPASVAAFVDRIVAADMPISILVNSAGIMATPLARDQAGHESQFATNHLGHFRLVAGLWPALVKAGNARVVSVSSRGHQIGPVDFDDIDFKARPYDKWQAYGQAKTANALFALELDRLGAGRGVRSFSLHPGIILTDLARHLTEDEIKSFDVYDEDGNRRVDPSRDLKTPEQGAATSVWAATRPELNGIGGVYCEDCEVALPQAETDGTRGVAPWAMDPQAAERLWLLSEHLTGLSVGDRRG
ncbi:oxidoreductase [Agrobacterium tumefaciens]|uniref:Probable oxidoreductase n=1 Tax=Agrobacterium tumefaciens TaxID=358 RepID=A0AB36EBR9_AGRTU|nr:oxidoreductase [Agrobacterium tumefaciens]MEA1843342.1 oxidoreductase [Agrobacterium tumefaciens]OCJ32887.1 oxidoreductase [Agrobacterium tumefaciens]OMP69611.1 oxidoreductase [Agrobacterium tumefaciens]